MAKPQPAGRPYTFRLPSSEATWLKTEAKTRGTSMVAVLRELITDARDFYGLPPNLRRLIPIAAEQEGLTVREYTAELLRSQAMRIINEKAAAGVPVERRRGPSVGA